MHGRTKTKTSLSGLLSRATDMVLRKGFRTRGREADKLSFLKRQNFVLWTKPVQLLFRGESAGKGRCRPSGHVQHLGSTFSRISEQSGAVINLSSTTTYSLLIDIRDTDKTLLLQNPMYVPNFSVPSASISLVMRTEWHFIDSYRVLRMNFHWQMIRSSECSDHIRSYYD